MTKPITAPLQDTLPPIKPWCFRVARTTAKKYGARENWPLDEREAHRRLRLSKRDKRREPKIAELILIAEAKAAGVEGRIARLKLKALKAERHIDAEQMRQRICERIMNLGRSSAAPAPEQTLSSRPSRSITPAGTAGKTSLPP